MKHIAKYTLAALLALALAACSKDQNIAPAPGGDNGPDPVTLSIALKGIEGNVTTYAAVPAEPGESVILPGETDIYMFDYAADGSGRLAGTFAAGSGQCGITTDGKTLTLSDLASHYGSQKVFYVVANRSCLGRTLAPTSATTEAEFAIWLTGELAVDTQDGKAALVAAPLLLTGKSAPVTIGTNLTASVSLRRPVARFDIQNECYGFFAINKIFVSDARLSGYIFHDPVRTAPLPTAAASLKQIAGPAKTAFGSAPDNIVKGVFYLYPTVLGETTIAVQASYEDNDEVVHTGMFAVNSACRIEANKRYKIVVDYDYLTATFDINVWPWDDGDSLYIE